MCSSPIVSAVIPTRGREDMLQRAIESIYNQDYDNIEIIVVETPDESGDVSKIPRPEQFRTSHLITDLGVGAAEARNIGIRNAQGEYIAFLDDDDEWAPKKTRKQVEELESPGSSAKVSVTGNYKIRNGKRINTYIPETPDNMVKHQLCWNITSLSTLIMDASLVSQVGYLDTRFDRREDQDFLLRLAQVCDFNIISEPLVQKHVDGHEQLGNNYHACQEANRLFKSKHEGLIKKYEMSSEIELAFQHTLGRTAFDNQDYKRARRHFLNALKQDPYDTGVFIYFILSIGGRPAHKISENIAHSLDIIEI